MLFEGKHQRRHVCIKSWYANWRIVREEWEFPLEWKHCERSSSQCKSLLTRANTGSYEYLQMQFKSFVKSQPNTNQKCIKCSWGELTTITTWNVLLANARQWESALQQNKLLLIDLLPLNRSKESVVLRNSLMWLTVYMSEYCGFTIAAIRHNANAKEEE